MNVLMHAIEGRMRVRMPRIKNNPAAATALQKALVKLHGVTEVKANPHSASVVIHYRPWSITQQELLHLLSASRKPEWEDRSETAVPPRRPLHEVAMEAMIHLAFEIGAQLLLGRLAGRRLCRLRL